MNLWQIPILYSTTEIDIRLFFSLEAFCFLGRGTEDCFHLDDLICSIFGSVNGTVFFFPNEATSAFLPFVFVKSWDAQQSQNRCYGRNVKEPDILPLPHRGSCSSTEHLSRGSRDIIQNLIGELIQCDSVNWGLHKKKHALQKKVVPR